MKKKSRFLQTPIEPFAVEAGLTADQVLARMERISFQGRNLATAHRIWQRMLQDDVTIFMGMAGALSAGDQRERREVARDDVRRHLAAERRLHAIGAERTRPCVEVFHSKPGTPMNATFVGNGDQALVILSRFAANVSPDMI